jgi:hypothetical protein
MGDEVGYEFERNDQNIWRECLRIEYCFMIIDQTTGEKMEEHLRAV